MPSCLATTLPPDFDGDAVAKQVVRQLDRGQELAKGFARTHTSHVKIAQAIKRSEAEFLRDVVDPFLRDKPPLPKARVPLWNDRGGRR